MGPPAAAQLVGRVILVAFLAFVPSFADIHLTDWTTFLALTIVFMSLSLLVRTSGQVSLAHISFVAIGACAFFSRPIVRPPAGISCSRNSISRSCSSRSSPRSCERCSC
jgi:hypothetical protein